MKFAPRVEAILREAGWFPGRQVSDEEVAKWQAMRPLFPAAERALREFAYLYFSDAPRFVGNTKTLAESPYPMFCIDPVLSLKLEENYVYDEWTEEWGQTYPLGAIEYDNCHCLDGFMIDIKGRVFMFHFIPILVGDTIEQALENYILQEGMRPWAMGEDKTP